MIIARHAMRDEVKRFDSPIFSLLTLALLLSFVLWCTLAPIRGGEIEQKRLVDGVYDGSYRHGLNSATVRVTISQGKIADIELIKHFASWKGAHIIRARCAPLSPASGFPVSWSQ